MARTRNYSIKLFLLGLMLLVACGHQLPRDPDAIILSMGAEPDTLNPITSSDAYSSQILGYLSDSLIERDKDTLEYKPKLAASWEISADHLVYIFRLRTDVTWHDGRPFTADDVIYTFNTIQDPKVEAPFLRVYYADITRIEKINDFAVKFVYKKPYFMGLSVCGGIPVLPKHIFETEPDFNAHSAGRHPIGTGPYIFKSWDTGKKITLVRNENYWDTKPEIKKIIFKIIPDDTVALQVLKKGDLDMASLRPIQWERQTNTEKFDKQFNKYRYLLPGYNYIGWNLRSPLFSDKRVRLALTHMVDRKKLLAKLQFGQGQVIEAPFFIESPQYNKNLAPIVYDKDKAQALLKEAGWTDSNGNGTLDKDGHEFTFTFLYPSASKFAERMATILKEDLSKIGIEMKIERMEWAAFLGKIETREFDATSLGWSTGFESDPYQIWHSSQSKIERGSNFVGFENSEADALIEKARVEFNTEKRNELYKKFQEILYEEQPYTFLFSSYSLMAVSHRYENVIVHKTGLDITEWRIKQQQ